MFFVIHLQLIVKVKTGILMRTGHCYWQKVFFSIFWSVLITSLDGVMSRGCHWQPGMNEKAWCLCSEKQGIFLASHQRSACRPSPKMFWSVTSEPFLQAEMKENGAWIWLSSHTCQYPDWTRVDLGTNVWLWFTLGTNLGWIRKWVWIVISWFESRLQPDYQLPTCNFHVWTANLDYSHNCTS